jgi:WD40 repeat protein
MFFFSFAGSYDRTVRLCTSESGQELARRETAGLVQCVAFSPSNQDVFFAGTTKKQLHMVRTTIVHSLFTLFFFSFSLSLTVSSSVCLLNRF